MTRLLRTLPALLLALGAFVSGGCSSTEALPLAEAVPVEFKAWAKTQGFDEIRFVRAHGGQMILSETATTAKTELPTRTSLELAVTRKDESSVEATLSLVGWRPALKAKELHYRIFRDPDVQQWSWDDQRREVPVASGTLVPNEAGDFVLSVTLPCQPTDGVVSFTASTLCSVKDAPVFFLPGPMSGDCP